MSNVHTLSNSAALEDLRKDAFAEVREFGRDSASGKDALPKLAIRVVELAYDGTFSEEDRKQIYDEYITAESKKLIHTEGGKAANASKLGSLLKMGSMTTIDPVSVINSAASVHADMRAQGLKPQSAYAAFVSVARAQISSPNSELTEEELRDVMSKASKEKTADSCLRSAAKAIEEAMGIGLNDDERQYANDALQKVAAALSTLISRNEREEKLAKIAELQAALAA
jgi:HPt (histidine-containing phosphotransfer) domain-containing protein